MANGMATINVLGTVGRDAETKQAGNGTVTEWSMAVNTRRGREDVVDWYRCSMWGARGEKLAQHIAKGTPVCVSGAFSSREYTSNGEKRTSLEINVSEFAFAGGKRDDGGQRGGGGGQYDNGPPPQTGGGGGFGADDIPF